MNNQTAHDDVDGVHAIVNTTNPSRSCDVVFVHGLGGSSHKTWIGDEGFFWPEKLGKDKKEIGIWTIGYPSGLTFLGPPAMLIAQRAGNIAYSLTLAGLGSRPIFFVTHSLGGLIVKQLVVRSQTLPDQDLIKIATAVRGIVFCGTPHQGSDYATVAKKVLGDRVQKHLQEMERGSIDLNMMHDEFIEWQRRTGAAIASFAENQPLLSSSRFGRAVNLGVVVNRSSANPHIQGYNVKDLDADHLSLVKPNKHSDDIYAGVKQFIERHLTKDFGDLSLGAANQHHRDLRQNVNINAEPSQSSDNSVSQDYGIVSGSPTSTSDFSIPSEKTPSDYIDAFLGVDPVAGDDAIRPLLKNGPENLRILLNRSYTAQHRVRLRKFCSLLGNDALDPLTQAIAGGPWQTKMAAAPCFSVFKNSRIAEDSLYGLLKVRDFDVQRLAIEGAGYSGYSSNIRWELIRLAKYDDLIDERITISDYSFGKLSSYVMEALARGFGQTGSSSELERIEEFYRDCETHNSQSSSFVSSGLADCSPAAADTLITNWLSRPDGPWACFGLEAIANLDLRRAVTSIAACLHDQRPEVRVQAGICLGKASSDQAARAAVGALSSGAPVDGAIWAVSTLCWKIADLSGLDKLFDIARGKSEVSAQMLLSLALRRCPDAIGVARSKLGDSDPFVRGTSALALAYADRTIAKEELAGLAEEASSDLERVFFNAAEILSGGLERSEALHKSLQGLSVWPKLRPFWRAQILAALELAGGDQRRPALWAEISNDDGPRTKELIGQFVSRASV